MSRHESLIYHLRQLNNWIKIELINLSLKMLKDSHQAVDVLDVACGQGGDISKWLQNHVQGINHASSHCRYITIMMISDSQVHWRRYRKEFFAQVRH